MTFFHTKTLTFLLFLGLLPGLGNLLFAQDENGPSGPVPTYSPTGIIVDGINPGNGGTPCKVEYKGFTDLEFAISVNLSGTQANNLYFTVQVKDNAGNIRPIQDGNNLVPSFSFTVDLTNGTASAPGIVQTYTPGVFLRIRVPYTAAVPLNYPADVWLSTLINMTSDHPSAFANYSFPAKVCPPAGPTSGGGGGSSPGPSGTGKRLANPNTSSNVISAGPNPFSTHISLTRLGASSGDLHLRLVDVQGKVHRQFVLNEKEEGLSLETSSLATGVYLLLIQDEQGHIQQKKLVKVE